MATEVRVEFPMDPETWETVITKAVEDVLVESEGSDVFVAEYGSRQDFENALSRFDGLIKYRELS